MSKGQIIGLGLAFVGVLIVFSDRLIPHEPLTWTVGLGSAIVSLGVFLGYGYKPKDI